MSLLKQVPALRKLYEGRTRLRDLLTKLDGNDELDALLKQVVDSTESQAALRKDLEPAAPALAAPTAASPEPADAGQPSAS